MWLFNINYRVMLYVLVMLVLIMARMFYFPAQLVGLECSLKTTCVTSFSS